MPGRYRRPYVGRTAAYRTAEVTAMAEVTKEQVKAAVNTVIVLSETIRELGEVVSGTLYAQVMGHMSFENYQAAIALLKRAELVSEAGNVLRWIGPEIAKGKVGS
jgi:hypothetical protein